MRQERRDALLASAVAHCETDEPMLVRPATMIALLDDLAEAEEASGGRGSRRRCRDAVAFHAECWEADARSAVASLELLERANAMGYRFVNTSEANLSKARARVVARTNAARRCRRILARLDGAG